MARATPDPSPERHQVLSYLTPLKDILFWEKASATSQRVRDIGYGDPHYDTTNYPNHEVVHIRPLDTGGQWFQVYYAATRETQDLYNYEIRDGKELVRTYVIPRATYRQKPATTLLANQVADEFLYPAAATADSVFTAYGFVGDTLVRADEIMDSLYVVVQRRFIEPVTIEFVYNTTLAKQIKIMKEVVAPVGDTAPTTSVPGSVVEIQKGNIFHDIRITQSIVLGESTYPYALEVLPGIYNKQFPPRLDSVDLNWAWVSAADTDSMPSYDEQYFFKFKLTEARPGPYASTVTQYITDDPAAAVAAYPITIVPQPVAESIGVASAWASAGEFGNTTRATAREWDVPPSLHEEVTVNVGGTASPLSTAVYTETLDATPGVTAFFALTSAIVDHPVQDAPLGLYLVSVVRVNITNLYDNALGVYVPLDTPANFAATTASDTQIDLTWDDVTGATSYQIFRSLTGAHFALIDTSATSNYSNTGLTASTLYYYRVRALGTAVSSAYSAIASDTTGTP